MNNAEAHRFIQQYFKRLFVDRDLTALDEHLHPNHWDDDIGESSTDHIQNSKEYLTNLFKNTPTIGVEVHSTMIVDNVITSFLEWFRKEGGQKVSLMKGVGIFVMEGNQILKRHNYLYYEDVARSKTIAANPISKETKL